MKSVSRLIKKIEKMIALSMKRDVYTIKFSNKNPVSVPQAIQIIQEMSHTPNIEEFSIWPSIKEVQKYWSIEHSYDFRRVCIGTIFSNANYFTFNYTTPLITEVLKPPEKFDTLNTKLAIVNFSQSAENLAQIISEINEIFEKYFDDSIALEQDTLPLKELQARTEFTKKDFQLQLPWLERFQDTMQDDISKLSFAHFLRERFKGQMLLGTYRLTPVPPPKFRTDWIDERIRKYFSFPEEYSSDDAITDLVLGTCVVKSIIPLPMLQDNTGNSLLGLCLHPFIFEQYGIPGGCEVRNGDTVFDCGAYTGDTTLYFSQKAKSGTVYAFEPIPLTAATAKKNLKQNHCVNSEVFTLALSDKNEIVYFTVPEGTSFAAALQSDDEKEGIRVETLRMDDFVQQNNIASVDFIKMDIEGAEMAALEGAKETIRRFKPDCAICVYHKKNDYWDIPHFLLEQCPEYKFYFRCDAEPVLFATVRDIV